MAPGLRRPDRGAYALRRLVGARRPRNPRIVALAVIAASAGCARAPNASPVPAPTATRAVARVVVPVASPSPDPAWPRTYHALTFAGDDDDILWLTFGSFLVRNETGGEGPWEAVPASDTGGAILYALASPSPERLYAAGRGTFTFSADHGATWQPVPQLGSSLVKGLAVASGELLALVHERGVVASPDQGASWHDVGRPPASAFGLWRVSDNPERLLSVDRTGRTVLASEDGGASWSPLAADGLAGDLWSATLAADGTAYAATSDGLFASGDGGTSWEARGDRGPLVAVATSPRDPNVVLVIDDRGRVFRSRDGGNTW